MKLLAPLVIVLSALTQACLDYWWKDRRTKTHKRVRASLIGFLLVSGVCSIVVVVTGEQDSKDLKNQLQSIESKLDPFLEMAKARFPGLDSTTALQRLSAEIKELEIKTKNLEKSDSENKMKLSDLKSKTSEQNLRMEIIKEFAEVALWDFRGSIEAGGGIAFNSPLASRLGKLVDSKKGELSVQCNSEALKDYQGMIKQYPQYPFPYLYIGLCLKQVQDPSWKNYATKGIEMFTKTTTVPRHAVSHDEGLKMLKEALQE